MDIAERWIARVEALARLGVKTQTLYAYVSRGRIAARPDPADPRRSLYAAEDVARLAGGGAPAAAVRPPEAAGAAARGEAEILSSLSAVVGGRLFYRGLDAVQLAEHATFEDVARRLWDARETNPFAGLPPRVDAVGGASTRARIFAALARRADEDPSALGRTPAALRAEAASLLNEVIDAAAGPGPRLHFHQRLGRGWKTPERDQHLIRRTLVLAADHELNPAVIAVRAAAGGGAPLAGAALAGLTTLVGSPLMRELSGACALVAEARRDPGVLRRRAEAGVLPGFCLAPWTAGDPRAAALIEALDLPRDLQAVLDQGRAIAARPPGLALALALIARRLELPRDGAADLLLLSRLAGLLGHALDQVTDGSPIRARLRYVGPEPGAH
jgi:citrate synthase